MRTALCPACESELGFAPWHDESASHEICPHCGIHFGYNDARADLRAQIYGLWREAWIANGRQPLSGIAWREASVRIAQRAQEEKNAS
jgi:Zn ribbon nucleic-acid-binding protein